jgi:hypothetical protein
MRDDELTDEHQLSEFAKKEADKLRDRKLREALVRRARQLETARQINQWLTPTELKQSSLNEDAEAFAAVSSGGNRHTL